MRDLYSLINRMLEVIPETEDDLRDELKDERNSVSYAAPEMMPMWFGEVQETLDTYVFTDLEHIDGWKESVRQIWVGEK